MVLVVLAVLLTACRPAVVGVSIREDGVTLQVGESTVLTVAVNAVRGASAAVTWSSDDESVATVTSAGQVTALAVGSAVVTATSAFDVSKNDSLTVTVVEADAVHSVAIAEGDQTLVIGDTRRLTAVVEAAGGASEAVTWSSSDIDVATVDNEGMLSAVDTGKATITATSVFDETVSDTVTATVTPETAVLSVTIWPRDVRLAPGSSRQLTTVVVAAGGASEDVTWSSSDTNVATIDDEGTLNAHATGTTTITATSVFDDTVSDTVTATVAEAAVLSVTIEPRDVWLLPGSSRQLTAAVEAAGGASEDVTWSSSDTDVATIDDEGMLSALDTGTTTITATSVFDDTVSDTVTATVTLEAAVLSVTIEPRDVWLLLGSSRQLTAAVEATGEASNEVTWSSSSTWVASVSDDGLVTGHRSGEVTITARSVFDSTVSDSVTTTVASASLSLDTPAVAMVVGEERTFTAEVTGVDHLDVVWHATGGTVSVDGLSATFTAPDEPGDHLVVVASREFPQLSASAFVTVLPTAERAQERFIRIVSEEVFLTRSGDSTTLAAVVFENGLPLDRPSISWASSDTSVLTVSSGGNVTAWTDVGSAVITASHGDLTDARLIAVAQPATQTRVVPRTAVLQVVIEDDEATAVTLTRSTLSEAIEDGDVLLSSAGILSRVTSVIQVDDDGVVLAVEPASLDEAFDDIFLRGTSDPLALEMAMDAAGATVRSSDAGLIAPASFGLDGLECEMTVGTPVDVTLTSGRIDIQRVITFTSEYEKRFLGKPRFLLQAEVEARLDAFSPGVEVAAGFSGTVECSLEVGSYIVPLLSFFGIVNLGGNLTPTIGFEIGGSVEAASIAVAGPFVEGTGFNATVGFEYRGDDVRAISESTFVPGDYGLGSFTLDTRPSATVALGPFFALGLGATIDVTTIKGVGVDVATPKLSVPLELTVRPPFEVTDASYLGPTWEASLAGAVELGLRLTGNVATVMKYFGLKVELASVSVPLFDPLVFLRSPDLSVSASDATVRRSVDLSVSGLSRFWEGTEVRFYAYPSGGGETLLVGTATVNTAGAAAVAWAPEPEDNGTYDVGAALYDSLFGPLEYPYATLATDRATVTLDIIDLPIGATARDRIAMGASHTVVLLEDRALYAWGDNFWGEVGDGSTDPRPVPVMVSDGHAGPRFAAVAAGESHTLALTDDGAILAWGRNSSGQVGDGTVVSVRSSPTAVIGFGPSVAIAFIAAGGDHSLAVSDDGALHAWGKNDQGQLGNGMVGTIASEPIAVTAFPSGTRVVAVAAGASHSLALTDEGVVYAWGNNDYGQLGDGTTTGWSTPEQVRGFAEGTRFAAIAAGSYHSLALTTRGDVYAWGHNDYGQLGDGTITTRLVPVRTSGFGDAERVVAIAAGTSQSFAITSADALYGWGLNHYGQLGIDIAGWVTTPSEVLDLAEATRSGWIATGVGRTAVMVGSGDVYTRGYGALRTLLGDGPGVNRRTPVLVLSRASATSALALSVAERGRVTGGDGSVNCTVTGGACTPTFTYGGAGDDVPSITLTAQPDSGYRVDWQGFCEGLTSNACTLNMITDREVHAAFVVDSVTTRLSVSVVGSGRVTSSDGRIDCRSTGGTCTASYTYSTAGSAPNVTLTATADANNDFTRWTGACSGGTTTCSLSMSSNRSVGASFADERTRELTICDVWSAAQSGGAGTTIDTWDISVIPLGASFDIRYDARSIPDKFVVQYPGTTVALDTGWRGNSSYQGDPNYPGGIAGPGQGEVSNIFTRGSQTTFLVTVTGPDPDTIWDYQIRCRE